MKFLVTCARGFESFLREELCSLGCCALSEVPGGVVFEGHFISAMRICLWSRLAGRVLMELRSGRVENQQDIYHLSRGIDVRYWFHPNYSIAVRSHVNDERFKQSHFLSLLVKDALVDTMRERYGSRCNVDVENPDIMIFLQIIRGQARIYLELQGEVLNKRGYRSRTGEAPLRENLAAGVVNFSRWDGSQGLCDPMCGSGTLVIEAALKALRVAPGIQRHFGFERWPKFDDFREDWVLMRTEAKSQRCTVDTEIVGRDSDEEVLELARRNAKTAGVDSLIRFEVGDFKNFKGFEGGGDIIMNPPYGKRLDDADAEELFFQIGCKMRSLSNHRLTVIAPGALLKKKLHMKAESKLETMNGAVECQVARYILGEKGRRKSQG